MADVADAADAAIEEEEGNGTRGACASGRRE